MEIITKSRTFLEEVWGEMQRTSWPSKPEVYGTTLVVVVAVFLVAFYLWVVDLALAQTTSLLFSLAS